MTKPPQDVVQAQLENRASYERRLYLCRQIKKPLKIPYNKGQPSMVGFCWKTAKVYLNIKKRSAVPAIGASPSNGGGGHFTSMGGCSSHIRWVFLSLVRVFFPLFLLPLFFLHHHHIFTSFKTFISFFLQLSSPFQFYLVPSLFSLTSDIIRAIRGLFCITVYSNLPWVVFGLSQNCCRAYVDPKGINKERKPKAEKRKESSLFYKVLRFICNRRMCFSCFFFQFYVILLLSL